MALYIARAAYYSLLIEKNKYKPRFLSSTVTRLTQCHSPIDPIGFISNDFMSFINKILTIKDKIHHLLPSAGSDLSPNTGSLYADPKPDIYLGCFPHIDLHQVTSKISASKPSTCLHSQLSCLKNVLPLVSTSLLDMINFVFVSRLCTTVL